MSSSITNDHESIADYNVLSNLLLGQMAVNTNPHANSVARLPPPPLLLPLFFLPLALGLFGFFGGFCFGFGLVGLGFSRALGHGESCAAAR